MTATVSRPSGSVAWSSRCARSLRTFRAYSIGVTSRSRRKAASAPEALGMRPGASSIPRPPCAPRIAVAWRWCPGPPPGTDAQPRHHPSPAATAMARLPGRRVSVQLRSPWSVVGQPPRGRPVTPAPDDGTTTAGPSTEEAISCGMAAGDNTAVLRALATSIALLPRIPVAEGEERPDDAIALPVIEQEGQRYIPVFTSEESLRAAGVDPATAVRIPVAELAANWPSDDFWLAVNPASEDGLGLPPDAVHMLPVFAEGGDGDAVEGAGPDTGTPAG